MEAYKKHLQRMRACEYDYAAFAPCGCLVGLTVDMGDKHTAKTVAEFISDGLYIERIHRSKLPELLVNGMGCKCEKKQADGQLALFDSGENHEKPTAL